MTSVAIIGGGITGLTAAFYLKRAGVPVTLFEAAARTGGVIRSARQNGYLIEAGPNTILETSPRVSELISLLQLESRRQYSSPEAEARYLVRNGAPAALPSSPLGFLTSNVFPLRARLSLLREPLVPRGRPDKDESVAEFVTRRLGKDFLDIAVDALVAGVYAGDPAQLSVREAFPKLADIERRYGSLIKGQWLGARERKNRAEVSKDRAPKFSFDEGLQVLTDALSADLGDSVRLRSAISKILKVPGGWRLETKDQSAEKKLFQAVVYAGTAFNLAALQIDSEPAPQLAALSNVRYSPVASVALGFRRDQVRHPCKGFGMLVPRIEGFKILGTIFSSSLFPNRAPSGRVLLTSYVGGERYPELAALPPDEVVAVTLNDLRALLGVSGQPDFQETTAYPRGIPQYNLGYRRFKDLLSRAEAQLPGLFFAGNYRDGVSLADSIISGGNAATRVREFLTAQKPVLSQPLQAQHD